MSLLRFANFKLMFSTFLAQTQQKKIVIDNFSGNWTRKSPNTTMKVVYLFLILKTFWHKNLLEQGRKIKCENTFSEPPC